jgi:hypothetical protein
MHASTAKLVFLADRSRRPPISPARFYYPPDFDDATKIGRIDFTGCHISFVPPGENSLLGPKSRIPIRLRAFRKIAEETKNHDLERDLYIEERKAERGVYWHQRLEDLKKDGWRSWPRNAAPLFAHLLWIAVMGTYWALADYGRSFMRPFAWLIASQSSSSFSSASRCAIISRSSDEPPFWARVRLGSMLSKKGLRDGLNDDSC